MTRGRIRTVRREGVWVNEFSSGGLISSHRTKDEAAAFGAELAEREGLEHVVHNADGTVGASTSYGGPDRAPG